MFLKYRNQKQREELLTPIDANRRDLIKKVAAVGAGGGVWRIDAGDH